MLRLELSPFCIGEWPHTHAGIWINVLCFYILYESGLFLQYFLRSEKIKIMKMDLAGHWTIWHFVFNVVLFESAFPYCLSLPLAYWEWVAESRQLREQGCELCLTLYFKQPNHFSFSLFLCSLSSLEGCQQFILRKMGSKYSSPLSQVSGSTFCFL